MPSPTDPRGLDRQNRAQTVLRGVVSPEPRQTGLLTSAKQRGWCCVCAEPSPDDNGGQSPVVFGRIASLLSNWFSATRFHQFGSGDQVANGATILDQRNGAAREVRHLQSGRDSQHLQHGGGQVLRSDD